MSRVLVVSIVLSQLFGCAIGNKQDYRQAVLSLGNVGHPKISVGVQDLRPDVVSGSEDEDYLGMQRAGFGNPYDVSTLSKRPLADEMSSVLVKGLRDSGANAQSIRLAPSLSKDQVTSSLKAAKPDKMLLLTLMDWESDTYVSTDLRYDAEMQVCVFHAHSAIDSMTIRPPIPR